MSFQQKRNTEDAIVREPECLLYWENCSKTFFLLWALSLFSTICKRILYEQIFNGVRIRINYSKIELLQRVRCNGIPFTQPSEKWSCISFSCLSVNLFLSLNKLQPHDIFTVMLYICDMLRIFFLNRHSYLVTKFNWKKYVHTFQSLSTT